jgi:hypothetical protein
MGAFPIDGPIEFARLKHSSRADLVASLRGFREGQNNIDFLNGLDP